MNSATSPQPDKSANAVAKLLERTRSINIRPDPEDAPSPAPAQTVAAAPVAAPRPVTAEAQPTASVAVAETQTIASATSSEAKREPRPRKKASDNSRTMNRTFDIVTGPSTRALTVRIPDEVHARLVIVATGNRLGRTGQASTLNELIAEGIEHVLERYDAA